MMTDVSGARATAAKVAAIPTTANAPGSIGENDHSGSTRFANPAPTDPPMNSAAMNVPTEPPPALVNDVVRILSVASRNSDHQTSPVSLSYTHLRAHETVLDLVCRLLLEKKKKQ